MERLVDADALKQTFCAECDHSIKCEDCDIDYHFEHLAPTVDIDAITESHERIGYDRGFSDGYAQATSEVRPGHWESSQGLAEVGEVQCSNCKTIYYAEDLYNVGETNENGIGQALMPNYCPHCGAYMGG